ncbi:MAG: hypothetical protein ACT4O7_12470 [Aquabacterium sp.]
MQITRVLIALAMAAMSPITLAGQYDWIASKLPTDLSSQDRSLIAVGSINSQRYLAAHVNAGDETQENFKPVLVLARIKHDNTYEPFKVIELTNLSELSVQIKDGAIYIRHDVAHHGTYFSSYKFKPSGASFSLVAMESQSMTLVEGKYIELWEGKSVNFVAARATYWAKAFAMDRPKEQRAWKHSLKLHGSGTMPDERVQRTVRINRSKVDQTDIEHFDPFEFNTDFLCSYFDHRLRFHNACQ